MKAFYGFKAEKASSGREILPAGAYVCEIKSVKEEENSGSYGTASFLSLAIEIVEGDYAGFWKKDFDGNDREDKKWRGIYRLSIPKDDGSEKDGWTKRTFGNFIYAVQESNPGYTWNWDEKTLKGKKVGVLYRNKEWEYNGRSGWTTEAAGSAPIEDVRKGVCKPLKDKPLANRPQTATVAETVDDEGDLPF